MEVRFVAPDLRRIDLLRCDALALGLFEDERPVRGALGLLDWRLCGAISRLLTQGRLRGSPGERLLLPTKQRLPFDKIFLFGLGAQSAFDGDRFEAGVRDMLSTLTGAGVRLPVIGLPGRATGRIDPQEAMERFLAVADRAGDHDEVTLIEDAEAHKVMAPLMEQAKRRARADVA